VFDVEKQGEKMARKKLDETEIRDKKISVRVNETELAEIKQKAKLYAVATPEYLRNLGLNYPLTSRVDSFAFLELGKCRADLGRLGGLLKMWVSNKDRRAGLDPIDVNKLLKEIEAKQEEITGYAKKLIEMGVV
jgi:hypothetical protein